MHRKPFKVMQISMQLPGDRKNYKREKIICFCWDHVTAVQPYNVLFLWKWFQCKYTLPQYPLIRVDRSIPWPLDTFPSLDDVDWTTRPTLSSLPFSPFTFLLLPSYNPISVLSMFLTFHSMSTILLQVLTPPLHLSKSTKANHVRLSLFPDLNMLKQDGPWA